LVGAATQQCRILLKYEIVKGDDTVHVPNSRTLLSDFVKIIMLIQANPVI